MSIYVARRGLSMNYRDSKSILMCLIIAGIIACFLAYCGHLNGEWIGLYIMILPSSSIAIVKFLNKSEKLIVFDYIIFAYFTIFNVCIIAHFVMIYNGLDAQKFLNEFLLNLGSIASIAVLVDSFIHSNDKNYKLDVFRNLSKGFYYLFTILFLNIILIILFMTFVYIHFSGYSIKSMYVSIFIFIAITLYLLIVERFNEKTNIENEIREIKNERTREHDVFLEKVKDIEQLEKNQLENIILKNCDDYDIKVWKIGRATSLLLGKKTPRNKVDIDVGEAMYGNLVSRAHGILNRVNGLWYYEDLGSQNGSGIERIKDKRKVKLKKNMPVKVESGDIIYLATTKLLLK